MCITAEREQLSTPLVSNSDSKPVTLLMDGSLTWATVGCRLTCTGGTEIPRFQQNVCDQLSPVPTEVNKASLSVVPPVNIRMVCAFLFLILSFFFS